MGGEASGDPAGEAPNLVQKPPWSRRPAANNAKNKKIIAATKAQPQESAKRRQRGVRRWRREMAEHSPV